MVARDMHEAEYLIQMGLCPVCNSELHITKQTDRHDDCVYHNETITTYICPEHGDMNELLYEINFDEEKEII